MRRVLTDLQSHFENEYRPSAETIGEKARAHVRVSCAVAKGAVFPAHAAQAVEQGIRRTVMAWGDKGRGGTGDQRELYKATSDTLEDNYSSSRPAAVWLSTAEIAAVGTLMSMRKHLRDLDVQRNGLHMLSLSARFGARTTVVSNGGVPAVIRALAAHPEDLSSVAMRTLKRLLGEAKRCSTSS